MSLRNLTGSSDVTPGTSVESRLSGLRATISDQLDDLHASGELEDDKAPVKPADDAAKEGDEADDQPDDSDADVPQGDPFRIPQKPSDEERTDSTPPAVAKKDEPPSPAGVDPRVKSALEFMDSDLLDVVKKYTPLDQIRTPDELKAATKLAGRRAWDLEQRNAELTRGTKADDKPEEPKKPEAPKADPRLTYYDTEIQSVVAEAHKVVAEVKAHDKTIAETEASLQKLRAKYQRGDAEVSQEDINTLRDELDELKASKATWLQTYNNLNRTHADLTTRKSEAEDRLAIKEQLSRQEKERTEKAASTEQEKFMEVWESNTKQAIADMKLPEKSHKAAQRNVYWATREYIEGGNTFTSVEQLQTFVQKTLDDYATEIGFKVQKDKKVYADQKSKDAPKRPGGTRQPEAQRKQRTLTSTQPTLRHLENQIMGADID